MLDARAHTTTRATCPKSDSFERKTWRHRPYQQTHAGHGSSMASEFKTRAIRRAASCPFDPSPSRASFPSQAQAAFRDVREGSIHEKEVKRREEYEGHPALPQMSSMSESPPNSTPSLSSPSPNASVSLIFAVSGSSPYDLRFRASSDVYLTMTSALSSWKSRSEIRMMSPWLIQT